MVHKEKSRANSQGSNHQTIKENYFCYSKLTYRYLNHQPHSFPLLGCGVHPLLSPKHRSPKNEFKLWTCFKHQYTNLIWKAKQISFLIIEVSETKLRCLRHYTPYTHLMMDCPVKIIIKNQTFNHNMLTGSVIHAYTMLNKAISVPSQIVTWNNVQRNMLLDRISLTYTTELYNHDLNNYPETTGWHETLIMDYHLIKDRILIKLRACFHASDCRQHPIQRKGDTVKRL